MENKAIIVKTLNHEPTREDVNVITTINTVNTVKNNHVNERPNTTGGSNGNDEFDGCRALRHRAHASG